jgi:hypothetical protein
MKQDDRLTEDQKSRIELGDHIEAFLKTSVGQYLSKRAEEERGYLLEQLAENDPYDSKAIALLQRRIQVLDSWQQWLGEALADAEDVERQFLAATADDVTGG